MISTDIKKCAGWIGVYFVVFLGKILYLDFVLLCAKSHNVMMVPFFLRSWSLYLSLCVQFGLLFRLVCVRFIHRFFCFCLFFLSHFFLLHVMIYFLSFGWLSSFARTLHTLNNAIHLPPFLITVRVHKSACSFHFRCLSSSFVVTQRCCCFRWDFFLSVSCAHSILILFW